MVKTLLLFLGLSYALVPAAGQPNDGIGYSNAYFGIEIHFPKKVGYTAYTSRSLKLDTSQPLHPLSYLPPDSTIQLITAKHFSLTMLKKELRLHDTTYLPTADFGHQTYEAARKNTTLGKYSNGTFTDFKGNKAFSFDVEKRLITYGLEVDVNTGEPFMTKKGMEQLTTNTGLGSGTHQVIYFSHQGRFFRILYRKNSKVAQQILQNLTLM
ncbi:hypothetical protein [Pontibacter sp. HSC-36F09]|uniref:hypothetical protein n=1 Tax=Pontibacter sp. HSC-36F09 TaxID=2910966 RepID=UPI0020A0E075|nr:hypothetical protein [Pontibacter sp. HSC-36F09]MCP2044191.1 hypothetical protein [Pontibacter sp. HSC-36F09]